MILLVFCGRKVNKKLSYCHNMPIFDWRCGRICRGALECFGRKASCFCREVWRLLRKGFRYFVNKVVLFSFVFPEKIRNLRRRIYYTLLIYIIKDDYDKKCITNCKSCLSAEIA